jgi:hypothetical protein
MLSRDPRRPLRTWESRKEALKTHANHRIWDPTPFISFTTDASAIGDLAEMRTERRGMQTLTVINPNVRVRDRLPILDMAAEMSHYGVCNPYGRTLYYRNHYLCLWEVTEAEVIRSWAWDDLMKKANWYKEIVLPAFKEHDLKLNCATLGEQNFDLSSLGDALPRKSTGSEHRSTVLILAVFDVYPDDEDLNNEEWATSSDEQLGNLQCWSDCGDTDDEVEEDNAADDMFKILEGD